MTTPTHPTLGQRLTGLAASVAVLGIVLGLPALFVLTKVDKLGKRERAKQLEKVLAELGVDAEQVLPFSAKTGEGREELVASVAGLLAAE